MVESPRKDQIQDREVYVGPRPFERSERSLFFGRDREISELLSLVTSSRVVLFYAPSGAGKTSLINAGLQPRLEKEGFEVLPSTRVRGLIPEGVDQQQITNLYVFNALLSLARETGAPAELTDCSIAQFLATLPHIDDEEGFPAPRILIIDQFEELLTSYPERWQEREGFFHQVHDALQADPLLRVIFSMREDFLARIEPFTRILKPFPQSRFHLDLLGPVGAQAAVTGPLQGTGKRFKDGVVPALIEELLKVRVETVQGEAVEVVGEYVEPVQLQVVCRNLWISLPADVQEISHEHLKAYGDVDHALRDFYESCVGEAKAKLAANELKLRQWFEGQLITPAGTRGIVFRDAQRTAELPNNVVDFLENRHLIRGEWRAGSRWYELTHDRLIEPIQDANRRWRAQRESRRNRFVLTGALSLLVMVLVAAIVSAQKPTAASPSSSAVTQSASTAAAAQSTASVAEGEAVAAQADAALSKSRQLAAEALLVDQPDLAILLAIEANKAKDTEEARKSLHRILSRRAAIDGKFLHELNPQIISPTLIKRFDDQVGTVASIAFSPLARQFVSASGNGTLILWNVDAAQPAGPSLTEPSSSIASVAFSPDGSLIASAGQDAQVSLWNAATGKPIGVPFRGHDGLVTCLAFSPDGKYIASGGIDGRVRIWEVATGKLLGMLPHADAVWSVAFSPDGKYLASGGFDSIVQLWDAHTLRKIRSFNRGNGGIRSLAWSPDSQTLASATAYQEGQPPQGEVILWEVATGKIIARPLPEKIQPARAVAFDPTGKILAIGRDDGVITLWDVHSKQIVGDLANAHDNRIMSIAFSPDGRYMVSGSVDKTIALWDLITPTRNIAISATGNLVATSQGATISLWNLPTNETTPNIILHGHTDTVTALVFSPDATTLVSAGQDDTIILWDTETGEQSASLPNQRGPDVLALDMSPDGRTLAAGYEDGTVLLWDLTSRQPGHGFTEAEHGPVIRVSFEEGGKTLEAASQDGTLMTWNLTSNGPRVDPIPGTHGDIASLAFSDDGQKAAFFQNGGVTVSEDTDRAHGIQIWALDQTFDPTVNPDDIDFIIVKASEGINIVDSSFKAYLSPIQSVPIRGAMHFFRGDVPWREQADFFLSLVKDEPFHFFVLDLESGPMNGKVDKQFVSDAEQWLKYVDERVDGRVLIEAGSNDLETFYSLNQSLKDWPLLVFQYPTAPDRDNGSPYLPQGYNDWKIWGYSEGKGKGSEYGTGSPDVFLAVYNGTALEMSDWLGITGFSIYDLASRKNIRPSQSIQVTSPNGIAFSPDGAYVAAASNGRVSLLDAASGAEITSLTLGGRKVLSLQFLPDSNSLAIGTENGTLMFWDLSLLRTTSNTEVDKAIDLACAQAKRNLTDVEWQQFFPNEDYRATCESLPQ